MNIDGWMHRKHYPSSQAPRPICLPSTYTSTVLGKKFQVYRCHWRESGGILDFSH
jgi:hypothetical protein